MNKESFMQELARLLGDISQQERQEALNFYEEYFHDAGPEKEQEVLRELGSPMQVAAKIKEGLDATIGVENGTVQAVENNSGSMAYAQQETENNSGSGAYAPQETAKKHSAWKTAGLVFLIICASPLLVSFAAVVISLIITLFAVLVSLIAGFGSAALGLFISCIALLATGVMYVVSLPYVSLTIMGSGLLCGGSGILFMMLTVWLCGYALPGCCRGIAWLWKKIIGKKQA